MALLADRGTQFPTSQTKGKLPSDKLSNILESEPGAAFCYELRVRCSAELDSLPAGHSISLVNLSQCLFSHLALINSPGAVLENFCQELIHECCLRLGRQISDASSLRGVPGVIPSDNTTGRLTVQFGMALKKPRAFIVS